MAEFDLGTLIRDANPVGKREFVGNTDIKDTYSFRLENDNNINIALTNMTANADVRLFRDFNANGIRDTNDSQISASTRFGNQPDSINVSSALSNVDAGSYLIEVDRVGTVNTEYDLRVSTNAISKPSNLVTAETEVGTLTSSRTFTAETISNADTFDSYHFAVNSSRNFRFNLSGLSADMDIRLINDRNNDSVVDASEIIASSTLGSNQSESITQFLTPGSTYYLQVYQYSGGGSYNLNMTPV